MGGGGGGGGREDVSAAMSNVIRTSCPEVKGRDKKNLRVNVEV